MKKPSARNPANERKLAHPADEVIADTEMVGLERGHQGWTLVFANMPKATVDVHTVRRDGPHDLTMVIAKLCQMAEKRGFGA